MSNSIATPFPFFAGLDGDALEGGKIYIGVDGLDAATNPKAAYFDRDLTVSAAQPIRTISGYAANGSSAAQIFADGAYSISVYTSNDVLVFSSLSQDGDISIIEADVSDNTAAIAALGTASLENFTDDDNLALDPDNVGTRGNVKAYVDDVVTGIVEFTPVMSDENGIEYDNTNSLGQYYRIGEVIVAYFSILCTTYATTKPADANKVYISGFPGTLTPSVFYSAPSPITWNSTPGTLPDVMFASGMNAYGDVYDEIGLYCKVYASSDVTNNGGTELLFGDLPAAGVSFTIYGMLTYGATT